MLEWLDAEIAAARNRILRRAHRRLHFPKRSDGQRRRWRLVPRLEEIPRDPPAQRL